MAKSRLTTIFLIVFVDILGFGLILPLLPYYAETYGASVWVTGLLVASYAAAQLIGAPLLGRLSDRFGRRPILLLSIAGTALGFLLLALAEPIGAALGAIFGAAAAINGFIIGIMFFSRILDGLTGGNISVAQAYITDVTDKESRAKGLGLLGAAFGFGFIIGPATGGLLSTWGYAVPAYVAAALAAINLVAVYVFLPESLTDARRAEIAARPRPEISFSALAAAFNRPRVGPNPPHALLLWAGLRHVHLHLQPLRGRRPAQSFAAEHRLCAGVCGAAFGHCAGLCDWQTGQALL